MRLVSFKYEKVFAASFVVFTFIFFPKDVFAMHIMEGYLSPGWCAFWGAVSLPFLLIGFILLKKRLDANPKAMIILALCGAFAFVMSALKIPSVTGSSSHPTGVGLGTILFGPLAACVISFIVLLFQALFLAHGGITTLGANVFSMGIAGPFIGYFFYKVGVKAGLKSGAVFLAAFFADISTYVVTSLQLSLAFPDGGSVFASMMKFLSVYAVTQLPLAVCEGLVTVAIFGVLEKYRSGELNELLVLSGGKRI